MDTERECGCKGRRSCLLCEEKFGITPDFCMTDTMKMTSYFYCNKCECAYQGWDEKAIGVHPNHKGDAAPYPGVLIVENFLTEDEINELMVGIDEEKWDPSQSGRRKQNYGPKCNFKKRKLVKGNFTGFPKFSVFVQKKLREIPFLKDFYVIEQCSLEYDSRKGACIDPHIDDCWIWGERIVTVNVLGDSVLTMIPYRGNNSRYNLDLIEPADNEVKSDINVRIPMPARSLLVIYGPARYSWEHCVLREDIRGRRVCLAYREFTKPYLPGGSKENLGKEILEITKCCVNF